MFFLHLKKIKSPDAIFSTSYYTTSLLPLPAKLAVFKSSPLILLQWLCSDFTPPPHQNHFAKFTNVKPTVTSEPFLLDPSATIQN